MILVFFNLAFLRSKSPALITDSLFAIAIFFVDLIMNPFAKLIKISNHIIFNKVIK